MAERLLEKLGAWVRGQEDEEALATQKPEVQALLSPPSPESLRKLEAAALDAMRGGTVVRRARRRRAMVAFACTAMVLFGLFFLRPKPLALPPYQLELRGAVQTLRGDEAQGPSRLVGDSEVTLLFTPAEPTRNRPALSAFLVSADGVEVPVGGSWPLEVSNDGALRVVGAASQLFGARVGRWALVSGVCPTEVFPSSAQALLTMQVCHAFRSELAFE